MGGFFQRVTAPIWVHGIAAAAAAFALVTMFGRVGASYTASNHPVSYAKGQTSFDGELIKSYYATMTEAGTLDVYVRTQLLDFGLVLAFAAVGALFCTFFARFARPESWGRRLGIWSGITLIFGATCDAIENSLSFFMLASPIDFPDWLALPYSFLGRMGRDKALG